MKIRQLFLLLLCLAGCATQQVPDRVQYEQSFTYPEETDNFVLDGKTVFDHPLMGAALTYIDRQYPTDVITVYVYPIPATGWDNQIDTLSAEMDRVFEEIDHIVNEKHFIKRTPEVREAFHVDTPAISYNGLKASFDLVRDDNAKMNSNTYLFIANDKFIKFRTSFFSNPDFDWNGDKIVNELLPRIKVPPESQYMASLREQYRRDWQQSLYDLFEEIANKNKIGDTQNADN